MKTLRLSMCILAAVLAVGCETLPSSTSGHAVVAKANTWEGSHYRYGVTAQCANWVGTVVKSAGHTPPKGQAKCTNWLSWGTKVPVSMIRPGDIVIYARGSSGYHHIAIYKGQRKVVHRPTRRSTVQVMDLHYRRIIGVRRPPAREFNFVSASARNSPRKI